MEQEIKRNDQVIADGKQWRVDWLGWPVSWAFSAVDGSHKELHKNVCRKVSNDEDFVADVLARVTMP